MGIKSKRIGEEESNREMKKEEVVKEKGAQKNTLIK